MFDSHAHLDHRAFRNDRQEILRGLNAAGVQYAMNVGCDLGSSLRSVALAKAYPFLLASAGSHPDAAEGFSQSTLALYRQLCREPVVRAVGEIGLDYHDPRGPSREAQRDCFAAQLELAQKLELPVILHIRDAFGDALDVLAAYPHARGVFHCFSGSPELALQLTKKGWYLGFTGVVTFKNARKAVEAAASIPLDRLLIETDCPYMAPEPHRGRRNDPSLVPLTAKKIAEIRGISTEEAAAATWSNAARLFDLSK